MCDRTGDELPSYCPGFGEGAWFAARRGESGWTVVFNNCLRSRSLTLALAHATNSGVNASLKCCPL